MKASFQILLLAIFVTFAASSINAQSIETESTFNVHARCNSIDIYENYLYWVSNDGVDVYSISDSSVITYVKRLPFLNYSSIAIRDSKAYLTGPDFLILDLNDPLNPEVLEMMDYEFRGAYGIKLHGDYAYVVGVHYQPHFYWDRLKIIDIEYDYPNIVYSIDDFTSILDFDIDNDTLVIQWYDYSAPGGHHWKTYDLTYPYAPEVFDTLEPPNYSDFKDVAISGQYVFSIYGYAQNTRIQVYDLLEREEVDNIEIPYAEEIDIYNQIAYVRQDSGFTTIDVSDPENCMIYGEISDPYKSVNIIWQDSLIYYVRDRFASDQYPYPRLYDLLTFNVNNPTNPIEINEYNLPDYNFDLGINGNYLFIANLNRGVRIFDISNPVAPNLVNTIQAINYIKRLEVDENYLMYYDLDHGLYFYDLVDPANPQLVNELYSSREINDLQISGDKAIISDEQYIHILDISTISYIDTLLTIDDVNIPEYSYFKDDLLYINSQNEIMYIYDVSDLSNPVNLSEYAFHNNGYEIEVQNGFAYVGNYGSALEVINVSDPAYPSYVTNLSYDENFNGVTISDELLFLSRDKETLIVDLAAPSNPSILASIPCDQCPYDYNYNASSVRKDTILYVPSSHYISILHYDSQTGIELIAQLPLSPSLSQNHPNPFNASTTISYSIPIQSDVTLDIYDILGRKVHSTNEGLRAPGNHTILFNSDGLSSGIYFYKLTAGHFEHTEKMTLMK